MCDGPTCRAPLFLTAALTLGAAWWFKLQAVKPSAVRLGARTKAEPWPDVPNPAADPRAYQLALARTRQAVYVQNAVALMKAGEPSRAMVELGRALDENALCRSPLLDGFGLIASAALFPMLTVMGYAQLAEWRSRRRTTRPVSSEE